MDLLDAIATRASALKLAEPGPSAEHLDLILRAGVNAPDHGKLTPWRFAVLEGDGRAVLAEAMVLALLRTQPEASEGALNKERAKPYRAPTIVAVAARIVREHKIPAIEQVTAVAAGVENMILAAHALGYGTMWKTGAAAYDAGVKLALGFESSDEIVGLLYFGANAVPGTPREIDLGPLVKRF